MSLPVANNQTKQPDLTPRNRIFVENILQGDKVLEAYHKAGYKGNVTAAYQLKHRLQSHIEFYVAQKVNLSETLNDINNLCSKEVALSLDGKITLNQKIRLLQLQLQAVKTAKETSVKEQKFTAFQINVNPDTKQTQVNIVDTTASPSEDLSA